MLKQSRVDEKHFEFIRSQSCIRCGNISNVECAHIRKFADGGVALKPSPWFCVPICGICHRFQHNRGEVTFWGGEEKIMKAIEYARKLYVNRGEEGCEKIVPEARREIFK